MNALPLENSALSKTLFESLRDEDSSDVLEPLFRRWQDIHDQASARARQSDDPTAAAKAALLLYALDQARFILDAAARRHA